MTQQAPDQLFLRGQRHWIAGVEGTLIDPRGMGVVPDIFSTGCYRGYISIYSCDDGLLVLRDLEVFAMSTPPPLNGVGAVQNQKLDMLHHYSALDIPCPFVKRLVVVREFDHPEFSSITPQPPSYDVVLELVFDHGRMIEERDHSCTMIEIRERLRSFKAACPIETWSDRDFDEYRRLTWSFVLPVREQPPVFGGESE
jgi:hypothetical protein